MLFFWGGRDKHIGADQIHAVIDECKRLGKPYVNVEISDADHGFFCDARASYHPEAVSFGTGDFAKRSCIFTYTGAGLPKQVGYPGYCIRKTCRLA